MSLINEFLQDCILVDKKRTSDGEGGFITEWVEGAKIQAAIVRDTSMSARVAEKEGVTATYTITTAKTVKLSYHDVLKTKDGKIFRVTSTAGEKETPASSNLDIAQVMAEKWELTS